MQTKSIAIAFMIGLAALMWVISLPSRSGWRRCTFGRTRCKPSSPRAYINATIGFEKLATALDRPPKSLMRMFGPNGNPTAENLLSVIGVLQAETGVHLEVRAVADAA